MTTLMIKDLALSAELDRKAMAGVRGGVNYGNIFEGTGWTLPGYPAHDDYTSPTPVSVSKVTTQSLTQNQGGSVQVANTLNSGGLAISNAPFLFGANVA
jgi:hypothetical protein